MATRPFWKGYLKLSLVTCAVALTPAITENAKIRFHVLNRRTGNRVVSRYVDAIDGAPVDEDNIVKGYEKAEDEFVLLEDEELDAVALESTRTIDIERFAPAESIDWAWYDRAHYCAPNDKVSEEAFAVIRDAMKATHRVGLARVVLYRRERLVMLKPGGAGMVLWTLRYADEVRDAKAYFEGIVDSKPEPAALDLVDKLIGKLSAPWSPELTRDPMQEKLQDLIAAKRKGGKRIASKPAAEIPPTGDVINIMDALRKSLKAESAPQKSR
jgi:DNA end-binding protein Ku